MFLFVFSLRCGGDTKARAVACEPFMRQAEVPPVTHKPQYAFSSGNRKVEKVESCAIMDPHSVWHCSVLRSSIPFLARPLTSCASFHNKSYLAQHVPLCANLRPSVAPPRCRHLAAAHIGTRCTGGNLPGQYRIGGCADPPQRRGLQAVRLLHG